jgi:DnaK suppressor protein
VDEEVARFRALLAEDRTRTERRLESLTADFDAIVASVTLDPPDDEHDPEGATVAFERAQVGALITQARRHLAEIDAAETRLDAGTYGCCRSCGRAIPAERLHARPTARTCVDCPSAQGA